MVRLPIVILLICQDTSVFHRTYSFIRITRTRVDVTIHVFAYNDTCSISGPTFPQIPYANTNSTLPVKRYIPQLKSLFNSIKGCRGLRLFHYVSLPCSSAPTRFPTKTTASRALSHHFWSKGINGRSSLLQSLERYQQSISEKNTLSSS